MSENYPARKRFVGRFQAAARTAPATTSPSCAGNFWEIRISGMVDSCGLTFSMPLVNPRTELTYGQIVEKVLRFESVFKSLFHK